MRGLPILLAAVAATAMTPAAARFADEHDSHKADDAAKDKADDSDKALASAVEEAQPSRGSVTTSAGRKIDYTVTPGTLTIRNDAGEATASMFYVAYVADNPEKDFVAPRRMGWRTVQINRPGRLHEGVTAPIDPAEREIDSFDGLLA